MLAQSLGSFVVWILYGIFQARRSTTIRENVSKTPRTKRGLLGAAFMLGGILFLFAGFLGIGAIGGLGKTAMTPIGWVLATFVGLVFVHLQTMGMAMLVSLGVENVTSPQAPTSTSPESIRES